MQRQLHHVRYLLYNVCCLRDQEIPTNRKLHKIIASSCHLILSKATQLSQVCIKSTVKISCDITINAIIIIGHAVRKR